MIDIKSEVLAKEWAKLTIAQSGEGELFEDGELAAAKILNETLNLRTLASAPFESLVGAVSASGSEYIVLAESAPGVAICFRLSNGRIYTISTMDLYSNGKKYKPVEDGATVSQDEKVEDGQPEHPKILTSLSEYSKAPSGTIVFASDSLPLVKMRSEDWTTGVSQYSVTHIAGISRKVARWGWKL